MWHCPWLSPDRTALCQQYDRTAFLSLRHAPKAAGAWRVLGSKPYADFKNGYSLSDMSDIILRRWIVSQIVTCQHGRRPFQHHCSHQQLSDQGRYRTAAIPVLTIGRN